MAKIAVSLWQPVTVDLDGVGIDLDLKRLNVEESMRLDALWRRYLISYADRLALVRRPGEEQARQADDKPFVLSDDEIRHRRVVEMSAEERARYEQLLEDDRTADLALFQQTLPAFVRVRPGQIAADVNGSSEDVTTGAKLLEYFGSRPDFLFAIIAQLRARNLLSDSQKNGFGSPSTSRPSSSERDQTTTGGSLEPTAAPVSAMGSAMPAAATPIATSPSGPTGS